MMITENDIKRKEKNSNIELLKIFAIFLIILSHTVSYGEYFVSASSYIDLGMASTNINNLLLLFFRYCGQIGNLIFVISSSFFLIHSKKARVEKIISIIIDSFIISVSSLLIGLCVGLSFSTERIIMFVLPVTFKMNWFIGCYLLLYAIHPLLNIIINNINKKKLLALDVSLFILYFIISAFKSFYYFNELICFISIYFFVAYLKIYMPDFIRNKKINMILFITLLIFFALSLLIMNFVGEKISFLNDKMMVLCNMKNPILLFLCISLFNIFLSMRERNIKLINVIGSCTLLIYLFHANKVLFYYYYPNLFDWLLITFGHKLQPIVLFIFAILWFFATVIISLMYKYTIGRIVSFFSKKIYDILIDIWIIFYSIFSRFH